MNRLGIESPSDATLQRQKHDYIVAIKGPNFINRMVLRSVYMERESNELINNSRLYSICGLVGNVLTVALTIGLLAFGILSVIPAALIIALCAVLGYLHYFLESQRNQPQPNHVPV
jgi:hypothetical protein